MVDSRYWIAFNRAPGVGAAKIRALLDHFGSLEAAWHAHEDEWKAAGLDRRAIASLSAARGALDTCGAGAGSLFRSLSSDCGVLAKGRELPPDRNRWRMAGLCRRRAADPQTKENACAA